MIQIEQQVAELGEAFRAESARPGSFHLGDRKFDVPAGSKVPAAHSHDGYEETIYGLDGVLTWTVEGTPTDVGPGEVLCIRRGGATVAIAIADARESCPDDATLTAVGWNDLYGD